MSTWAADAVPFVFDLVLKSVLLILLATVASLILRRSAAAVRHLMWLCTLIALLFLPLLMQTLPGLPVPGWQTGPRVAAVLREQASSLQKAVPSVTEQRTLPAAAVPQQESVETAENLNRPVILWWLLAGAGYILGIVVVLAQVFFGMKYVRRFEQNSTVPTPDSPLCRLADEAAVAIGLRAATVLRLSETVPVPMTWGWRRPVILLPAAAKDWSEDRLRAVLLHEMAHIARADWPAQMLSHTVCAVYWFHPLVWFAASRLRAESEQAADDRVLLAGVPPTEYARHLLEIAQTLPPMGIVVPPPASAMVSTPHLEKRLRALLTGNGRRLSRRVSVGAIILSGGTALGLATVRADEARPILPPAESPAASSLLQAPRKYGVLVERVAIEVLAIGTRDGTRWWTPDGKATKPFDKKSPIAPAFQYDPFGFSVPVVPGQDYRRILLRARFAETDEAALSIPNFATVMATKRVQRSAIKELYAVAILGVSKTDKELRVPVLLANGAFQERAVWHSNNPARSDHPTSLSLMPKRDFKAPIQFFTPKWVVPKKPDAPRTEIWVQDNFGKSDARIVVRDGKGKETPTSHSSTSWGEKDQNIRLSCMTTEAVRPEQIRAISFQTRLYQRITLPPVPTSPQKP